MIGPAILAVDADPDRLGEIERELTERYARSYSVAVAGSADDAHRLLEQLAADGRDVAIALCALDVGGVDGADILDGVRSRHRHARRGLLVRWESLGQRDVGEIIFQAMAADRIDQFVFRPMVSPDEQFHSAVSSMLLDWADAQRTAPNTVRIVGESWTGRAHELREALQSCAVPHDFCLVDSPNGRATLEIAGADAELPLLQFPDGSILQNPTNAELALATGGPVCPEKLEFDVVVVGAGPAGLSAAVYGASEGLGTLVVDRGGIGGQATSSSLIRNYLGFPRGLSGRRLAQNAYHQAWVFGADFTFMHTVTGIRREGRFLVLTLDDGTELRTVGVLLAMGATYQRLGVPSIEAMVGAGVFYGSSTSEAVSMAGAHAFIVGGANSAGQAALHLARYARQVTMVIRADSIEKGMSHYLIRQIDATPNIDVRTGTTVVDGGGVDRLEWLTLRDGITGEQERHPAQGLFLMIGARPLTDWLPDSIALDPQGFVLSGDDVVGSGAWSLERPPLTLETSMPGVFAAGDVRHGGVRRVASAVGEGSIAIQQLHQYFALEGRSPVGRQRADEPDLPDQAGESGSQHLLAHIYGEVYVQEVPSTLTVLEVIAEPTRRRILDAVRSGERSVGELVDEVGMHQPGVSRHLKVLRDAGLVEVRRDAQRRLYRLRPEPLMEIDEWLEPYRREWANRLDSLERHLERTADPIDPIAKNHRTKDSRMTKDSRITKDSR